MGGPSQPPNLQHKQDLKKHNTQPPAPPLQSPPTTEKLLLKKGAATSGAAEGGGARAARARQPLPKAGSTPKKPPFAPPRVRARPQLPGLLPVGSAAPFASLTLSAPPGSRSDAERKQGRRGKSRERARDPQTRGSANRPTFVSRPCLGNMPPARPLAAGEILPRHQYVFDKSCQVWCWVW